MKPIRIAVALALVLSLTPITEAQASECTEPTLAPSSLEPTLLTIIDTEVGTEAFERLVTYSNGGHSALGKAIAQAHQWFAVCEYVGVGIGSGSGGNGYRPNFMLALWRDGIDIALAPTTTTTTTPTMTVTTTTPTTTAPVSETATASEPVVESEQVITQATTTTTVLVVESAKVITVSVIPRAEKSGGQ